YSPEAKNAFGSFAKWFYEEKPEVIRVEEVIYSRTYGFAGTYDCMLNIRGKTMIADLKTTNASRQAPDGVYAENFLQLGGYALAHEEQRVYEEGNGGSKLLPIEGLAVLSAKKDGKFDIITNEDIGVSVDDCKVMFARVAALHGFLAHVTKNLGGR